MSKSFFNTRWANTQNMYLGKKDSALKKNSGSLGFFMVRNIVWSSWNLVKKCKVNLE